MDTEVHVTLAPYGESPDGTPYLPHPTQQRVREWVQAVRAGQKLCPGVPVLYVQHGVDAGGTRATLTPVIECLLELPGIRVLIGRKDYTDLRVSVMETFKEIIPVALIAEANDQEHRVALRSQGGGVGTVFFRELKDVKGLGSQEFAILSVHEAHEIDLFAYRTLKQRCRQQGFPNFLLLEGNPPSQGHWLDDAQRPGTDAYDPDLTVLKLTSYENKAFMPPGYLESLEAMPPSWRRRYLMGETGPLPEGTPIYPAFVETVHVQSTRLIPDRPILRGWDFGLRRAACVWGQVADSGQVLWHREWLALETPETQFIEGVLRRTREWFGDRPCRDVGDPAAAQRDPEGVSTLQRLSDRGIHLLIRQSTYGERIPLLNRVLSELVLGQPKVVISPDCHILIEGLMGGYHYPSLRQSQEFSTKRDVPYRDGWFEHLVNAWEYPMVWTYGAGSSEVLADYRSRRRAQARRHRRLGAMAF